MYIAKSDFMFLLGKIEDLERENKDLRHWVRYWENQTRAERKKNTIIINEIPKGSNIPKFGD